MLNKVVAAVKADQAMALAMFQKGEGGLIRKQSPPDWCANRAALRSADRARLRWSGASRKGD
jgi:hypothetical protein